MPIHEDDPAREGNLSDEEYAARLEERRQTGDLHRIPAEALDAAYARADEIAADGESAHSLTTLAALPGSPITYNATGWLTSYGPFSAGRPWGRVLHTLECDARPGVARSLSEPGGYLDNEGLAPHGMSDPSERVRACNTNRYSGHVGGRANPLVVGYEVTGRAGWSPQQWLDGGNNQAALESDARLIAWDCVQDGWARGEIRMLSGAQIRQNYNGGSVVRGFLDHNDVSEFIGGTNHWDPGTFVHEWFLGRVRFYYDQFKGNTSTGTEPAGPTEPAPIPDPAPEVDMLRTFTVAGYHPVIAYGPGVFKHLNATDLKEGIRLKWIDPKGGVTTLARADEVQALAIAYPGGDSPKNVAGKASDYLKARQSNPAPATGTEKYTIKSGDTLSSIAAARKTTVDALRKLNPQIINPELINAGDIINVPKA